jgi:hypothetical protein
MGNIEKAKKHLEMAKECLKGEEVSIEDLLSEGPEMESEEEESSEPAMEEGDKPGKMKMIVALLKRKKGY